MKYTFINEKGAEQTVTVPDDYIKINKHNLGLSTKDAIMMYLSDEGYISNDIVDELTAKAKENGVSTGARGGKTRKAPTRKPDYTKRALVDLLYAALEKSAGIDVEDKTVHIDNMEVTNIERMIAFTIGNDKYEVTLSKKRAPKK